MYYRINRHRLPILLLVISLASLITTYVQSPVTSAHGNAGSAMRLRLTVQRDTIRSGETTKITVEFLDRDYQQVPSDGTRNIEFGLGSPSPKLTGSGAFSPPQVTVKPGSWSAETTFAAGKQSGRVLITARTDGLDPAQAVLVVRPAGTSFLSGLLETVAYAAETDELSLWPDKLEAPANGNSQAILQVSFMRQPSLDTEIRICVQPPATIIQNGVVIGPMTSIKLAANQSNSEHIGIASTNVANVEVTAVVLPRGLKETVHLNFIAPVPKKIVIDNDQQTIPSNQRAVPISIQLADDGGFPIAVGGDQNRKIRLSSATDADLVYFEPDTIVLARDHFSAHSIIHFKEPPRAGEITVLASDDQDHNLKTGQKIIAFQSPIVTAVRWLLLAAVFGGAVGGLARQLHKADRLDRIMPQWTGKYWDLGLSGRISGSIVSGLFLYWTMKFGLARVTLDLGSTPVAFFFGGIGGFAGLVVLDRLVEWCFKLLRWSLPEKELGSTTPPPPAQTTPAPSAPWY